MLTLTIKKKWFDMILSGEKKEEYRECSRYYFQKFRQHLGCRIINGERVKDEFLVRFKTEYGMPSKSVVARCTVRLGHGKPEWGSEPDKGYYVLSILSLEPER